MAKLTAPAEPVLRLEAVTVRYDAGGPPAVDDVTLTVHRGERIALVGLNGSGKTTLLLVPAGLVPFAGRASVAGISAERRTLSAVRRKIGFLFSIPDDQILFPRVLDDVGFTLRERGLPRDETEDRARRILDRLGAGDLAEMSPHQLSQGQRVRVALAGAMVGEPDLLLLDEPSSFLDPVGKARLARILRRSTAGMVLATHDLHFAREVCTHYAFLRRGRLTAEPRPSDELSEALFQEQD